MQKLNQKGFGMIEGLLIVIALTMIAGVGFYVVNANKDNSKATQSSQQTTTKVEEAKKDEKKYLEIKELGIKFELNDKLKDAYYFVHESGFVYISVRHFDSLKGFEGCTARGEFGNGGGLAVINAAKVGDDHFGTPLTQADLESFGGVKIGDRYYAFEGNNQAPCHNPNTVPENDPNIALFSELKQALVKQQPTITKL